MLQRRGKNFYEKNFSTKLSDMYTDKGGQVPLVLFEFMSFYFFIDFQRLFADKTSADSNGNCVNFFLFKMKRR